MTLVCLAPYVGGPDAPYAGSQLLHRHLSRFAEHCPVTLVAPATDANVAASESLTAAYDVIVTPLRSKAPQREIVRLAGLRRRLSSAWRPRPEFPEVRKRLVAARLVELQWAESLPLVGAVRRLAPDASLLAFEHDLAYQALERQWLVDGPLSAGARRRLARERRYELGLLSRVDEIAVLKDADREELALAGIPAAKVRVMPPSLSLPAGSLPFSEEQVVLFVGAMNRPENHVSIMRFVREVWPEVVDRVPEALLIVAGAGPKRELLAAAGQTILVTGEVPDLEHWYRRARITVAPLLMGAGLRFKVPQSMAYGRPVVGSTLAYEGLDPPERAIGCRSDDRSEQVSAIVRLLRDPALLRQTAQAGREWASTMYDYDQAVDDLAAARLGQAAGARSRL